MERSVAGSGVNIKQNTILTAELICVKILLTRIDVSSQHFASHQVEVPTESFGEVTWAFLFPAHSIAESNKRPGKQTYIRQIRFLKTRVFLYNNPNTDRQ